MLLDQHPYFVRQGRSRASGYQRPCSSRAWSACRMGTLNSFFRAGRPLPQLDGASVLVLHFDRWLVFVSDFNICHAYPAFVLHPRFSRNEQNLFVLFAFVFPRLYRPLWVVLCLVVSTLILRELEALKYILNAPCVLSITCTEMIICTLLCADIAQVLPI